MNQRNLEEVLHILFPKERIFPLFVFRSFLDVFSSHFLSLYPELEIVTNARKEALIRSPVSDKLLELDVWIPKLNIAFEFQV